MASSNKKYTVSIEAHHNAGNDLDVKAIQELANQLGIADTLAALKAKARRK